MAEAQHSVKQLWQAQARRFALWVPVLIAAGVWMRFESVSLVWLAGVVSAAMLAYRTPLRAVALWGAVAVIAGFGAAEWRISSVAAPILDAPWRGEVSGRVRMVDASLSGAPRLTLDHVSMGALSPVPARLRVSARRGGVPQVGDRVTVSAVLDAPRGPAEPGGFDFSRRAYFDQLGAVGYAVGAVAVERVTAQDLPLALRLDRWRGQIAASLRAHLPGEEGAIAAALTVGDRSAISEDTRDALRDSGLAHLLAISGLHVGLLGGLIYWLVRLGLALPPVLSERVPIRKVAALCALAATAFYLVMSGAGVATQRAFIMAAVALIAIILDRAAVTLRGVAVAAVLILLLRPESLFEAGFQMSFAAVAALVAGYDATRGFWRRRALQRGVGARFVTGALATTMTSVLAGAATAPFAAYHFNRLVIWGLPANLLATPAMGLWIMPCIILAAVLVPFGLEAVALVLLGLGIGWILRVAEWFGGLDGAVEGVVATAPLALFCIVFGGLWGVIWRGRIRVAGIVPAFLGLWLWAGTDRPDLFIARDAALVAGRGEDGQLWIGRARAERYTAQTWLRREGTAARPDREAAYQRREWSCTRRRCKGWTGQGVDRRIIFLRLGAVYPDDCTENTLLIAPHLPQDRDAPCLFIGSEHLTGASSLTVSFPDSAPPRIEAAYPWFGRQLR